MKEITPSSHYMASSCRGAGCHYFLTKNPDFSSTFGHQSAEGTLHEHLVSEDHMMNPDYDLWEEEVQPWIERLHGTKDDHT